MSAASPPASATFLRRPFTCESTVRSVMAKPSPHTRSMSCARVNTRPGAASMHASRSNSTRVKSISLPWTLARHVAGPGRCAGRGAVPGRARGAAEHGAHAGHDLAGGEGLRDVVVGARLQRGDAVRLAVAAREHDHGR